MVDASTLQLAFSLVVGIGRFRTIVTLLPILPKYGRIRFSEDEGDRLN